MQHTYRAIVLVAMATFPAQAMDTQAKEKLQEMHQQIVTLGQQVNALIVTQPNGWVDRARTLEEQQEQLEKKYAAEILVHSKPRKQQDSEDSQSK